MRSVMRSVVWGLAILGLVWVGDVVYEEKVKMSAFNRRTLRK